MKHIGTKIYVQLFVLLQSARDELGQDMVEYALLTALISIFAMAILFLMGPYLKNLFQDVINATSQA